MLPIRKSIGGVGNLMFKQAYLYAQIAYGKIPDTYLQSEKYFTDIAPFIKEEFGKGIGPRADYIALHIRRGDYLKAKHFHTDLSETEYYQKAVKLFPKDDFLVFCKDTQNKEQDLEDRKWCADFLNSFLEPQRWKFASFENSEIEDMNLMASCKGHIMANSTFSWWAAWLNPNSDKQIVCPAFDRWFVDGVIRCDRPITQVWNEIEI